MQSDNRRLSPLAPAARLAWRIEGGCCARGVPQGVGRGRADQTAGVDALLRCCCCCCSCLPRCCCSCLLRRCRALARHTRRLARRRGMLSTRNGVHKLRLLRLLHLHPTRAGYVGMPVSRTCDGVTGTWNGTAVSCAPCSPPAAPTDGYVTTSTAGSWIYGCNAGTWSGATVTPMTRTCQSTGAFTGSAVTCSSCGSGYYCTGNSAHLACPAGTWSSLTQTRLATAACSGSCTAGYYCPVGSTSPTASR